MKPEIPMRESPPCGKCEERFTACHDHCPKDKRGEFGYAAWKANLEKIKEERIKYQMCRYNLNNNDYYKH